MYTVKLVNLEALDYCIFDKKNLYIHISINEYKIINVEICWDLIKERHYFFVTEIFLHQSSL